MPDHDHGHSGASDHGHQHNPDIALTALTVLGLAVALVDRFGMPLPLLAVQGGLALAFLAGGVPAGFQALKELFGRGRLDIDMLMVIAALAAAWVGAALEGAVLLALFSASGTLEHRAMGRARRAVEALMALRPDHALRLLSDGSTEEVAVVALVVGDKLVLRSWARVPVDGRVLDGAAAGRQHGGTDDPAGHRGAGDAGAIRAVFGVVRRTLYGAGSGRICRGIWRAAGAGLDA